MPFEQAYSISVQINDFIQIVAVHKGYYHATTCHLASKIKAAA